MMKKSLAPSSPGSYVVRIPRADDRPEYISAPAGWFHKSDGSYEADGSVGCEVTDKIEFAYGFSLHAARRQAVPACGIVEIHPLLNWF